MTVTYQSASALAYGGNNVVANYPASLAAGNAILLLVGTKPNTAIIVTPTGFIKLGEYSGGAGTTGADTGPTKIAAFVRISTGSESGTLTCSITSGNSSWAQMYRWSNATGLWNFGCNGGVDSTTGTAWSATCAANPGITSGDWLLVGSCTPTDVGAGAQFSVESVTATSATLGSMTEISEPNSATGNDVGGFVFRMACSAGTATAAPVITATAGGTTTNVSGPSILVRLREVASHTEENETFETGASEGGTYGNTSGLSDGGNGGAVEWRAAAKVQGTYGVRFPVTSALNRVLTCATQNYLGFAYFTVGMSGTATATGILAQFRDASANTLVNIRVNATTGLLTLRDNNTDRATSSTAVPTDGTKIRVGFGIFNGQVLMRIWDKDGALVEDESTLSGTYTGAGAVSPLISELRFGTVNTVGALTVDFDYVSYSLDDWVTPLPAVLEASGTIAAVVAVQGDATGKIGASGTIAAVSETQGNPSITYPVSGTCPVVGATQGNPTGLINVSGTVASTAAASGDATRLPPAASGTVAAVSGTQGNPGKYGMASGLIAAIVATQGAVTAKLQAAGTSVVTSGVQGDATKLTGASGTSAAVVTVQGDATRIAGSLPAASGTVPVVAATQGDATMVASISGTVAAVAAVQGNATRVPIVYQASGTVPVVAGASGDATRVTLVLAASGTVAVVCANQGDATRVLQTLQASGTVASIVTVQGNATRVPIIYQASGTVPAVVTTSGDASIVFVPPSGGPELLVPLSPERDRDLARR